MSSKQQCHFIGEWLKDPEFSPLIVAVTGNDSLAGKFFKLSNMGRQASVSHASTKKHKTYMGMSLLSFNEERHLQNLC